MRIGIREKVRIRIWEKVRILSTLGSWLPFVPGLFDVGPEGILPVQFAHVVNHLQHDKMIPNIFQSTVFYRFWNDLTHFPSDLDKKNLQDHENPFKGTLAWDIWVLFFFTNQ